MVVDRCYARCVDCLWTASVDAKMVAGPFMLECGLCGGRVESMGRVSRVSGRLIIGQKEETPCDWRCTCAVGPKCDCPCGGRNHGTGRSVTVEVTDGRPPRVTPTTVSPDEMRARVAEYHVARSEARARLDVFFAHEWAQKRAGEWVANFDGYMQRKAAEHEFWRACKLRTHKGRIRALNNILPTGAP